MERESRSVEAEVGRSELNKALGAFEVLREALEKSLAARTLAGLAVLTTLEACGQFSEDAALKTRVAGMSFEIRANPSVDEAKRGRVGGMLEIVGTTDGDEGGETGKNAKSARAE